jgi:hypothetical protein
LGFGVWGLGFGVWVLGVGCWVLGYFVNRVQGLGDFGHQGSRAFTVLGVKGFRN